MPQCPSAESNPRLSSRAEAMRPNGARMAQWRTGRRVRAGAQPGALRESRAPQLTRILDRLQSIHPRCRSTTRPSTWCASWTGTWASARVRGGPGGRDRDRQRSLSDACMDASAPAAPQRPSRLSPPGMHPAHLQTRATRTATGSRYGRYRGSARASPTSSRRWRSSTRGRPSPGLGQPCC